MSDPQGVPPAPRFIPVVAPEFAPEAFEGVVPRRAFAYLIDLTLILLAGWLFIFVAVLLGIATFGLFLYLLPMTLLLTLWPTVYHTLSIGGPRSATPGMRVCGIEVRVWHGGRPGYLQALLHTVVFYASITFTAGLILVVPLFHNRGRCLHDILCGTVVVRAGS